MTAYADDLDVASPARTTLSQSISAALASGKRVTQFAPREFPTT